MFHAEVLTLSTYPAPVLLDLYGTLVAPGSGEWVSRFAEMLGLEPAEVWRAAGPSFQDRMLGRVRTPEQTVALMLREVGCEADEESLRAMVEARWTFFHTITLFDDSLPALDRLRAAGHPLAMVSNCSAEVLPTLDRLGLRERFDALALSCELDAVKPQPRNYLYACEALGVRPESCVFVGDGENQEHAGAKALGMTTVWIRRPGARPREVQADYTIASLLELLDLPGIRPQ